MAWTAPPSYTNGQIITQTDLHTGLRDNMRELWHEVAYVEFSVDVASASAAKVDVVSAGAVTFNGYPVVVEFYCPMALVQAPSTGGGLFLIGDGTDLGNLVGEPAVATTHQGAVHVARRFTPTAASHTYKVQIAGTSGGATSTAYAGAGGAGVALPGFIRVLEKGGA